VKVSGARFVQGRNRYGVSTKYGIAIHNTSNDASDEGEASYATRRTDGVSSHFYVDADSVTQSLDTRDIAGHAGSSEGNRYSIAVEITGANGWSRDRWLRSVAWDRLGAVLAQVIRSHWPDGSFQVRRATVPQMKANPRIKALYGHNDMRLAWGGTTHTDPGPNFPWDRLTKAITDALGGAPSPDEEDTMPTTQEIITALLGQRLGRGTRTVGMQLQGAAQAGQVEALAKKLDVLIAERAGEGSAAILDRLNQLAAEEERRAEADEARDAELRDLFRQYADGQRTADETIVELARRLMDERGTEDESADDDQPSG
jgi:N-acetyl-anhydromuramyl-L-alanine amidase AmpD